MNEWPRLFLLLALAGVVVTLLGSVAAWTMDEERRIRRALKRVLKGPAEAVVIARGRGRGAGFNTSTGLMAVTWDTGGWLLIYRLDELMGAEVIVDGQVVARAYRGEPRRALDQALEHAARVTLRLIFDDPHHPDFDLDLWLAGDETRRRSTSPGDAMQEANRWLARAEAILRRPIAPRVAAGTPSPLRPDPDAAPDEDDDPPFHLGSDERVL
ncbi:hypothetical protein ASE17_03985 [Phenylobacterium sp. Root77]|jgi:hypothetical protein|uniref:hypothetical protein n=1 Tax=unclassified Phenylobacterium TaxID=2640670 RepID=UPI0006FC36D7|nr:hypothetical protein [Phenylobacterium sp. Root77]KQW72038.1 hypothetical protein ASC73_08210 [Phenylobacterium sp. Root1277]KQW94959.1 hypothetical protein ASC79_04355 [Phenylobacterium sp. Root1290]KRC44653.1 hypothetical protein ASE17_03985 [Phenylobacterium sp. Root77]